EVCPVRTGNLVLGAAAWAIGQMLERLPDLTLLATSRTPLDLPGESVVPLGPLDGGDRDRPDSLALFLAAVVDSGGSVESIDLEVAAEICRRLDGVPLALEIAAGRLRTMAPAELLASIDTDLGSLARPRCRGRSSHQGVAAMVAVSIQLLDVPTRDVFDALGVFAGSFSVDAAAAVTASTVEEVRLALD